MNAGSMNPSLRRAGPARPGYGAYLASRSWWGRRSRWFAAHASAEGTVECVVCLRAMAERAFDLHHLDYSGVVDLGLGKWQSRERDEDLMALCRQHHDDLHSLLDADRGWTSMGRRQASLEVASVLRAQFAQRVQAYLDAADVLTLPTDDPGTTSEESGT